MRKILFIGNVGKQPEQRTVTNTGEVFVTFSVAVSVGNKANPKTDWYEVNCNGRLSEIAMQYINTGDKVYIEGVPSAGAYINKENKPVPVMRVQAGIIERVSSSNVKPNYTDEIHF